MRRFSWPSSSGMEPPIEFASICQQHDVPMRSDEHAGGGTKQYKVTLRSVRYSSLPRVGGTVPGVKELNMASLRAGNRHALDDKTTSTGLAFGDEYREKLTREAGAKPSMVHKQKNQIGTLLYNAKQKEMEIMQGRLAGVSHKAMAKQKYGW